MQKVVIDEPYEFVPPVRGLFWPRVLRRYLCHYLWKSHGIERTECRHVERLRASLGAGHSIMLTPNHVRMSDPLVLGLLAWEADCHLFAMASWHLFKQNWFQRFMVRRMGAFSVYREGNDRQAIDTAINILVERVRPLVIFPEGVLSRHNDLVNDMMEGPSFIARQAAKRLQKSSRPAEVVIHPVAIRYAFNGDLQASLLPVLDRLEERLSWQPQSHLSLVERIAKIARAILALKELEFFDETRTGHVYERAEGLVGELLAGLESKWDIKDSSGNAIARVKRLRTAIVPDMIAGKVTPEERARRWRDLAACYYAQQASYYRRDYILREKNLPERVVETVERLEEDFTDVVTIYRPFAATLDVGEAIPVSPQRDRSADGDPVMAEVKRQLQSMIDALAAERTPV